MTPAPPLTNGGRDLLFAFVNHALMEVGSAVADVQSDSATVWVATKSPTGAQSAVADAVGLSVDQVTLNGPRRRLRAADLPRAGGRGSARVACDRQAGEADVDPQR